MTCGSFRPELQRGRAHVSAESHQQALRFGKRTVLQRGRAHVSAESSLGKPSYTPIRHCFNGAALT